MKRSTLALASALLASLVIASCGGDNAIVGGDCRSGLTLCGSKCVDLTSDPLHCGSCAQTCGAGGSCQASACLGTLPSDGAADAFVADSSPIGADTAPAEDAAFDGTTDALEDMTVSPSDGTTPPDATSDASMTPDATSDATASPPDATADTNMPPTDATSDGLTVPPDATSDATVPPADATSDGPTPSDAGPDVTCPTPLLSCGATCLDVASDPFNCGGCGVVCLSQLCRASTCVGGTPGSFVYVGNDYANASSSPQARVLSNAVFATSASSVRVLAYQRYADSNATAAAATILSAGAVRLGRTLQLTTTNVDGDIPGTLAITRYDTLLVFDQSGAPAGALSQLGASWGPTLRSFTLSGGVVVVLDGGLGRGEMPAFATGTTLLNVSAHAPLSAGSELDVLVPSDVVGTGVITPYGAGADTVTVTTESASGNVVYVVAPPNEAGVVTPAVVHKVF